jgi:PAS domain-containing protein
MGYKVILIDDKQVNQSQIKDLLKSNDNVEVFDNISSSLPITEVIPKLKKVYEIIESDDIEQRIKKIKEERDVLIKLLSDSSCAPFAFIVIRPSGVIEWVNDGFEKIHGFKLSEYIESHGNTIFSLDPSSEISNIFNKSNRFPKPV